MFVIVPFGLTVALLVSSFFLEKKEAKKSVVPLKSLCL